MSTQARRLEGKVAIITGAASGVGEATARLFAKHGAKLILADVADVAGQKVAESLSPWATYIHCDVSKEQDVSAAVDLAMEKHGQLDIMFNNAGVIDAVKVSAAEYEMEGFERVMGVNLKGVMHGIKHAARIMVATNNQGCIISTGSIGGILGGLGTHAYIASKHAVVGLTKNCAAELGKYGIRVNCISPSGLATNFGQQSAMDEGEVEGVHNSLANLKGVTLKAEDIAKAALYLAGEDAKYVSGHNLVVDGGFSVVNHSYRMFQ